MRGVHHKVPLSHISERLTLIYRRNKHLASNQADSATEICSSATMSSANMDTTIQPTGGPDTSAITLEDEGNQPASSLDRLRFIPYTTTAKDEWNGNPMDWKSWPTGRPGPLVSDAQIQKAMGLFRDMDRRRRELSRTETKVFHIAEYSSTGRGEFDV
jgi:hypothetical protein